MGMDRLSMDHHTVYIFPCTRSLLPFKVYHFPIQFSRSRVENKNENEKENKYLIKRHILY